MRKKDEGAVDDAQEFSGLPAPAITPADIQQKEFHVSRFGGYRMRDVDEYLDQITEAMTKLVEDNQRLRSTGGMATAPAIGAPDLADTSRQADEIIARARAEAAAIVQQAREQAVAGSAGGDADAGRAAIAPFLSRERDFLQQLATLVQGHAESVKGMAKAGRTAKPAAVPAVPAASAPVVTPAAVTPAPPAEEPSAPAEAPGEDAAEDAEPTTPKAEASAPQPTQPIRVQEPATASVGAGETADDDGGSGEGDRSLRELFWGEE